MLWFLLLLGAVGMAWFLFTPRRLQKMENVPQIVDEKFRAHNIVETTEDPHEVDPIAREAQKRAGDQPVPGHGDSLTFDWPSDKTEPHQPQHQDKPYNPQ